jgi:hypothetical protein
MKEALARSDLAASFLLTRVFAANVFVFFPGKWLSEKSDSNQILGPTTLQSIPSVRFMGQPIGVLLHRPAASAHVPVFATEA